MKQIWEQSYDKNNDRIIFFGHRGINDMRAVENAMDTYELPDGRQYPKQCFWLNNTYIYDQISDEIKS